MQVVESKATPQAIPRGIRCKVCDHESVTAINTLLASASLSNRRCATQFGLTEASIRRHKDNHLPAKIVKAAERAEAKSDDLFMERLEYLWSETTDGVARAKNAARTVTDPETGELCYVGRDLGPLAPLLGQAHKNLELLGNATGRLNQAAPTTVHNHLSVIMPRAVEQQPAIEQGEVIDVPAIEPGEPPAKVSQSDSDTDI